MITNSEYLRNDKPFIYGLYNLIIEKPEKYDNLTRNQMYSEIINALDKNYKLVYFLASKEEILTLYSYINNKKEDMDCYSAPFLGWHPKNYKVNIVEGYYPYVKKAVDYYLKHEEECEKEKEIFYLILGLILTFGALYIEEFTLLLNKYLEKNFKEKDIKELLVNPYIKKYATYKAKTIYLNRLEKNKKDILSTHYTNSICDESKTVLIERGKNLICLPKKILNEFKSIKNANSFLKTYLLDIICYSGFNNIIYFLKDKNDSYLLKDFTEKDYKIFINFADSLPKWLLKGNACLNEEDTNFFYKTYLPFIRSYGHRFNIETRINNETYDQSAVAEVIEKANEEKFKYLDEYLKTNKLENEEIAILQGFRKCIYETFIVYKYTNNGAIFIGSKNSYLVKGLHSPFEEIFPNDLPIAIKTVLLPFKGVIISNGIYQTYAIKMGKGIQNQLNQLFDEKKVITSFYQA